MFNLILSLCRCCLIILILFCLLLRKFVWPFFLQKKNLFIFLIVIFICVLLILVRKIASLKSTETLRETVTPFECGFDSKHKGKIPFSIRFFSFLILFLVFDVELVLFVFFPISEKLLSFYLLSIVILFFVFLAFLIEEEIIE
jgi:NADH:ubiquinone oxidoreductase subunit 3 (subunit A)